MVTKTPAFVTVFAPYFRDPHLNSNYYFNKIRGLERNDIVVHQYGGRVGGPIVIPGLVDGRNRAFFFFNMEEFYQPTEASRTRSIRALAPAGSTRRRGPWTSTCRQTTG